MDHQLPSSSPVLLAVDDDPEALARIERELGRRYGADYRVVCLASAEAALAELERLRAAAEDVALVLAAQWTAATTGSELLARARQLHPHAKRGLLIEWGAWGDRPTADAIFKSMALGDIDYYVLKPWWSPDEQFHRTIGEFLYEWTRALPAVSREVEVVGPRWSARSHELRSLLARNGVPHAFHASDSSEGQRRLEAVSLPDERRPVAILVDGQVLVDPEKAEVAAALGVSTELEQGRHEFDVVVIGAGPAGLGAAVYGASEGLTTLVIEREAIGGQAGSSSLIRNYLGFSRGVSGSELAQRGYQQAWVFGTEFVLMRDATSLRGEAERIAISISDGSEVSARTVLLAMGVTYRRLDVPSLEQLVGAGVFYGASTSEAQAVVGGRAYVVGGGNSAGQAALHLSRFADQVTILIRADGLTKTMSHYLLDTIAGMPNIDVRARTEVVGAAGDGRLAELTLRTIGTDETESVPAEALFVMIGARPHTEWLPAAIERDKRGFLLTGSDVSSAWPLPRSPLMLETSMPGVFAAGDVRHGSVKRVAAAVGQGAAAIQQVHEYLTAAALHQHQLVGPDR